MSTRRFKAVEDWHGFGEVIDTSVNANGVPGVHVSTHGSYYDALNEAHGLNTKGVRNMAIRAVAPAKRGKGRPVKGANFQPKRVRKQVRKSLVRAMVTNKVADIKMGAKERAAFYRSLRELKMRRRAIAAEFAVLATMVDGLHREVHHVEDRYPGVSLGLLEEASMLVKTARAAVSSTADEMQAFSRRKVYFTEAVAA